MMVGVFYHALTQTSWVPYLLSLGYTKDYEVLSSLAACTNNIVLMRLNPTPFKIKKTQGKL